MVNTKSRETFIKKLEMLFLVWLLLTTIGLTYYSTLLNSRITQRDVTVAMWQEKSLKYEDMYNSSVQSCMEAAQLLAEHDKAKELAIKTSQSETQERLKDIVYSEVKPNEPNSKEVPATGSTPVDPSIIRMLNTAYCSKANAAQCTK